jgi:hypothetical protein
MFSSNIACAAPSMSPLRIDWMKRGMSMPVGQAAVQGAAKQK